MSGHSKWSTIKRQKGANDAKRGQLFTKLASAITVAVKEGGGGDPTSNFRLRLAIEKARQENMPKDNIDRSIERGLGKTDESQIDTVVYEGFGPGGVAVMVEAMTDNRNRTTAEVKMTYDKYGGTFAQPGTVNWQFKQEGELVVSLAGQDTETALLSAIEAGASDVVEEDDVMVVYTPLNDLHAVKQALEGQGMTITDAKTVLRANQPVEVANPEESEKIIHFLERLEDLADVQAVYTNALV